MVNEPDFICDIEKSIRLEFTFHIVYLLENAIDLTALLAFCAFSFPLVYCALGIALSRLIVFGLTYLTQRKTMNDKSKQYFVVRKLLNAFLWVTIAASSYLQVSFKPTMVILIVMAIVMFAENCNCNGDVF